MGGEVLEVGAEVGVFAGEESGEGFAEIGAAAPFAHVVFPGGPETDFLGVHIGLVNEDVGALEQGDKDLEEDGASFELLGGQRLGGCVAGGELEVGVFEDEFEELGVLVGEANVDLFLFVASFFSLVVEINPDGERQADDGDGVAEGFEVLHGRHAQRMPQARGGVKPEG